MTKIDKVGCGHDGPALPLAEARARVLAAVTPVEGTDRLPVRDALGRVLAKDAASTVDVPGHNNSAMDGYALRSDDLSDGSKFSLLTGGLMAGWQVGSDGQRTAGLDLDLGLANMESRNGGDLDILGLDLFAGYRDNAQGQWTAGLAFPFR